MSNNWTSIDETLVRASKVSDFLDAVQGRASMKGEADPLPALITKCTGRILAAVMAANDVDTDATKIPASLEWLALNLITREVKGYIEIELNDQEKQQQRNDDSYLLDIVRIPIRFAPPDNPAGTGNRSPSITAEAVNVPCRMTRRNPGL